MPQESGPDFIGRNRPSRVEISYKLQTYGAMEKVQLPFVMGIMADLSGKPVDPLPSVNQREFLEIDVDNFEARLRAIKPRAAFVVPNTLTGEGNLPIDITFESLADFLPDRVARKIEPLRKLLEQREQLARLLSYMDGKESAEKLVGRLLTEPKMQAELLGEPAPEPDPTAG